MAFRRYFQMRGWEKFQHYKHRNPPWIRLYVELLDHWEYTQLSDSAKSHLVGLWMLASKTGNRLPFDPVWLKKRIGSDVEPDLLELQRLEFIEPHASTVQAGDEKHASTVLDQSRAEQNKDRDIGQNGTFDLAPDKQVIHRQKANGATRFADFWAEYPTKVKKRDAEKVWRSRHLDAKADALIADVKRRRAEDRAWRDGFVPHPTTYLRGERWNDELQSTENGHADPFAEYTKPLPEVK